MQTDVLIIGAGPIGLLLANLLGSKGINTTIVDKKKTIDSRSRAIGITPPSLKILKTIDLDTEFISKGVKISDVAVMDSKKKRLGSLSFSNIPSETPFVLSLPQTQTENILLRNLSKYPSVNVLLEAEVTSVVHKGNSSSVSLSTPKNKIEIESTIVCGCDGFRSTVRDQKKLATRYKRYKDTFLMGDFHDSTPFKDRVLLFFTPFGSVESFPLPESKRRWVIQTSHFIENPDVEFIIRNIHERSGYMLKKSDNINLSPFKVYKSFMSRFYDDGILFLGDAAHTISPIGGQGMNSGFGDAELALAVIENILDNGFDRKLMRCYSRCRKKAAKTAAFRAELSMGIGTVKGRLGSSLRNFALKILLSSPIKKALPKHYAMLTIPFHNVDTIETSRALKKAISS